MQRRSGVFHQVSGLPPPRLSRRRFVVLFGFSNRCLSCSDQTRSTTWLHPRTGEPVNSGHMIRSGTPLTSCDFPSTRAFLVPRCGCSWRFNAVSACFTDLPRGWEEGFTDEGASYFIKSVAFEHCFTALACCFSPPLTDFAIAAQCDSKLE